MKVQRPGTILAVFAVCVLTSGCATNRWSLHNSAYSYNDKGEEIYSDSNTLLLDRKTGETWMLLPSTSSNPVEDRYEWRKLDKK